MAFSCFPGASRLCYVCPGACPYCPFLPPGLSKLTFGIQGTSRLPSVQSLLVPPGLFQSSPEKATFTFCRPFPGLPSAEQISLAPARFVANCGVAPYSCRPGLSRRPFQWYPPASRAVCIILASSVGTQKTTLEFLKPLSGFTLRGANFNAPGSWQILLTMILKSSLVGQVSFPGLVFKAFSCQGGKPRAKRLTPRINPAKLTPGLA